MPLLVWAGWMSVFAIGTVLASGIVVADEREDWRQDCLR
jgi:hypothetical protein